MSSPRTSMSALSGSFPRDTPRLKASGTIGTRARRVVVLKGEAKLLLEDGEEPITMRPGDHALISPHRKHRVEWTTPDEPTVWLAVFLGKE